MSELKRAFTAEQLDALREIGFDNIQKAAQELGVWTVAQNTDAAEFERNQQALAAQFNHPFYARVDAFRDEVKVEALTKAATKYNEPFNPASWSVLELGKHAMAENYDQGNYIVGLMDAAQKLEDENKLLKEALRFSTLEASFWRAKHLTSINPNQAEKAAGGQANDE